MATNLVTSSSSPSPGDNNPFKRKLLNFCIAALMVIGSIAQYYHLDDLGDGCNAVKWILDLIALFL